jgi:hypothetical protein
LELSMKFLSSAILGAVMVASLAAPASAQVDFGLSFGEPDTAFQPCDYSDYYDEAPPWGLPEDYCDYPVYFEPVYFGGSWYRGPIYYRWTHGRRLFWLNGGWREDGWRGPRPGRITWSHRGGHFRGGPGNGWHGREWRGGVGQRRHDDGGDRHPWERRGDRPEPRGGWGQDRGHWGQDRSGWGQDRSGWGSDHGGDRGDDRGSRGGDHNGGNHFGGGENHGGGNHGGGGGHHH